MSILLVNFHAFGVWRSFVGRFVHRTAKNPVSRSSDKLFPLRKMLVGQSSTNFYFRLNPRGNWYDPRIPRRHRSLDHANILVLSRYLLGANEELAGMDSHHHVSIMESKSSIQIPRGDFPHVWRFQASRGPVVTDKQFQSMLELRIMPWLILRR